MVDMVFKRLLQAAVVLLLMSVVVFVAIYQVGNPIDILINPQADIATREALLKKYGMDQSLYQQYLSFAGNVLRGDFGNSFVYNSSALKLIASQLPATLELAAVAMLITILLGIPLGLYAGYRPSSPATQVILGATVLGFSVPSFWMGLMLILVFAVELGWVSSGGRGQTVVLLGLEWSFFTWDGLKHLALPALNLALFRLALIVRLTQAGVAEALTSDYVRFARAKGVPASRIIWRHIFPNIMIPILAVLGLEFGAMIAFSVVTETIFSWPGTGKLVIDSIRVLDRPVVVAYLLMVVALFIFINLVVDLIYVMVDPRVRARSAA